MNYGMLCGCILLIAGGVFAEGNIPGPPGNFNFQTLSAENSAKRFLRGLFNSRPDYRTSLFPGIPPYGVENLFNGAAAAHTMPLADQTDDGWTTMQILWGKLFYSMPFIVIPLAYAGLSVFYRELVYREDLAKNGMGFANAFVSLSLLGAASGGVAGFFLSDDNGFNLFVNIVFTGLGAVIGFTAGSLIAFLRPVETAFKDNAYLYYSAPVLIGAVAAFPIFMIWRY